MDAWRKPLPPLERPPVDLSGLLVELLKGDSQALIVTGPSGSGKTWVAQRAVRELRGQGISVGGILSPRILRGGVTVGYRVRDLMSGEEELLCRLSPAGIAFRRFYFSRRGLELGNRALAAAARSAKLAVVDEVGPFELAGGGFSPGLRRLRKAGLPLIITVRPQLVSQVLSFLRLPPVTPRLTLP